MISIVEFIVRQPCNNVSHLEELEPQEGFDGEEWLELQDYLDGKLEPAKLSEVNKMLQEAGHETYERIYYVSKS
tara:strand:+ start:3134 stop:3355 length:222 start_codon:yes stop_codon:yes gene_type:complete